MRSLFKRLERKTRLKLVVCGLDGAGKTSCLSAIFAHPGACVADIQPTVGVADEMEATITLKSNKTIHLTVNDVGGSPPCRGLWRFCLPGAAGVVFVMSARDRERLHEAVQVVVIE